VVSSPHVLVVENKKALVKVAESVPVFTAAPAAAPDATSIVTTQMVEFKDAGVVLTVTPRIGEQGGVLLDLRQELSEVGEREPPPVGSPRAGR
jgi:general secretion pathway protein D